MTSLTQRQIVSSQGKVRTLVSGKFTFLVTAFKNVYTNYDINTFICVNITKKDKMPPLYRGVFITQMSKKSLLSLYE